MKEMDMYKASVNTLTHFVRGVAVEVRQDNKGNGAPKQRHVSNGSPSLGVRLVSARERREGGSRIMDHTSWSREIKGFVRDYQQEVKTRYKVSISGVSVEDDGLPVVPIIVDVCEYAEILETFRSSILESIKLLSKSNCQLIPPVNAFEYLFLSGRAVVIFTGLDFNRMMNWRLRGNMESFCRVYPLVTVLIIDRRPDPFSLDVGNFEELLV